MSNAYRRKRTPSSERRDKSPSRENDDRASSHDQDRRTPSGDRGKGSSGRGAYNRGGRGNDRGDKSQRGPTLYSLKLLGDKHTRMLAKIIHRLDQIESNQNCAWAAQTWPSTHEDIAKAIKHGDELVRERESLVDATIDDKYKDKIQKCQRKEMTDSNNAKNRETNKTQQETEAGKAKDKDTSQSNPDGRGREKHKEKTDTKEENSGKIPEKSKKGRKRKSSPIIDPPVEESSCSSSDFESVAPASPKEKTPSPPPAKQKRPKRTSSRTVAAREREEQKKIEEKTAEEKANLEELVRLKERMREIEEKMVNKPST